MIYIKTFLKLIITSIFIVLAINFTYANQISFYGTISDENGKVYNGYSFIIKDKDQIICKTKSKETFYKNRNLEGVLNLNCDLDEKKEYFYEFRNKDGKKISEGKFSPSKEVITIGPEDYNNIKFGIYSKKKTISIFSPEYEEIKRKEYFENIEPDAGALEDDFLKEGKVYIYQINFLCKNGNYKLKNIEYNIYINGKLTESGYSSGVKTMFKKGETGEMIYYDGKEKKKIKVNNINNNKTILIENCNKENSEKISKTEKKEKESEKEEIKKKNKKEEIKNKEKNENIYSKIKNKKEENNENKIEEKIKKEEKKVIKKQYLILIGILCLLFGIFIAWIISFLIKKTKKIGKGK